MSGERTRVTIRQVGRFKYRVRYEKGWLSINYWQPLWTVYRPTRWLAERYAARWMRRQALREVREQTWAEQAAVIVLEAVE